MANNGAERPELRLVRAWLAAERQAPKRGLLRVVPVDSEGRQVQLSVTPEGWRGLVMPIESGEVVNVPKEFRSSSRGALRAEVAQFSAGAKATDALHVWCRDPKCNDAFTAFSVFLLDRKVDEKKLEVILAESYAEFERLLGAAEVLDGPRLTGLVGELLVLLDGVRIEPDMVMHWAGPRGERHDFRKGKSAIEVKCSLRSELKANRVQISDWDQLESPEGGGLHLHSIRLEQVTNGDWSVPSLLDAIKSRLDSKGLAVLDELLAEYDQTLIDCTREFSVKERSTYHVIDGFPRLVPSMLLAGKAPGVSGVSYALDLDHAEPFSADWNKVLMRFFGEGTDA
ncbi:PD-(D/E)XK motif protein [Lysobacter sp. A286]